MPTLVFDQLDATIVSFILSPKVDAVFINDGVGINAPLSSIISATGPGSWEANINLTGLNPGGLTFINILNDFVFDGFLSIEQVWTVNYNRVVLPVPDNARVKKLTFRRPRTINLTFTNTPNLSANAVVLFQNLALENVYFTPGGQAPINNPCVVNEVIQGSDADEIVFDFTAGSTYITKTNLIASWNQFNNNLNSITIANQDFTGSVDLAISGTIVFGLGWTVTVEYEDSPLQWNIDQTTPGPDIGDTVNLTSPSEILSEGDEALDMSQVTDIDIKFTILGVPTIVPVPVFTIINNFLIIFIIPPLGITPIPSVIEIILTSTQFSGTVSKQMYTITFVSASGIYSLTPGSTSDILYIEEEPGDTIEVKIPDPFGKTGYI